MINPPLHLLEWLVDLLNVEQSIGLHHAQWKIISVFVVRVAKANYCVIGIIMAKWRGIMWNVYYLIN